MPLAGCSDDGGGGGGSADDGARLTRVTLAPDWTPNTNHTGIYVAQRLGWFEDAGIDLRILPYGSTPPEVLLANHKADFGISYQEGLTAARAAGQDIVSLYAVTQKTNVTISVQADRDDIRTPKDLDGKTYAGFGAPYEKPLLREVIRNAGGTGDFRFVALDTAAYAALYAGKADFVMPMPTWEGLEAELRGEPLKDFRLGDYGFPEIYSTLIASSDRYLEEHGDTARAFLSALHRGYTYAADHPGKAAELLLDAAGDTLTNRELVKASTRLLAREYYRAPDGTIGGQSARRWQGYADFAHRVGLLTDADGHEPAAAPDTSAYFTDDYLPER